MSSVRSISKSVEFDTFVIVICFIGAFDCKCLTFETGFIRSFEVVFKKTLRESISFLTLSS